MVVQNDKLRNYLSFDHSNRRDLSSDIEPKLFARYWEINTPQKYVHSCTGDSQNNSKRMRRVFCNLEVSWYRKELSSVDWNNAPVEVHACREPVHGMD